MPAPHPDPLIFLLSPATLGGVRGRSIREGRSSAPFMARLTSGDTAPLGDVYAFISSLYYRGKRAYGRAFGRGTGTVPAVQTITPCRGLRPDDHPVDLSTLRAFADTDIAPDEPRYLDALLESARALDRDMGGRGRVVLLGSIASAKYVDPLAEVFGRRLLFPRTFIGRGDMSRGGLLLRAVEAGRELEYVVAVEAERNGTRPARLPPHPPASETSSPRTSSR